MDVRETVYFEEVVVIRRISVVKSAGISYLNKYTEVKG